MSDEIYGKDVRLSDGDIQFSDDQDFNIISGKDNLFQAISDRLLTIKGEYYNTEYGSELNKTIGKNPNNSLKNQIIGYVVEALNQEPRVKSIENISVDFETTAEGVQANIIMDIIPIDSNTELNLVFPFFITGE